MGTLGKLWVRQNKSTNSENSNMVGQLSWPIIVILRILGYCPISHYEKVDKSSNEINNSHGYVNDKNGAPPMEYGLKIKSRVFLWALFVLVGFTWNKIVTSVGSHNTYDNVWRARLRAILEDAMVTDEESKGHQGLKKSMIGALQLSLTVMPVGYVCENILSWTESPNFAQWLNNWQIFQTEFYHAFPANDILPINTKRLARWRNVLMLFYFFCPTFTLVALSVTLGMGHEGTNILFSSLAIAAMFVQNAGASLLEDLKVLLSYHTLANGFLQIREGIHSSLKFEKVTPGRVKSWRRLVSLVKEQGEWAGRWQKEHQLFILALTIVLLTFLMFLLLLSTGLRNQTGDSSKLKIQGFGLVCILLGRVYMKILAAEKITTNEELVANELLEVSTIAMDNETRLEIKFLHDLIRDDPTRISFGAYVILNKKFLLRMLSQVVTYIIVLTQFSQSRPP